MTVGTLIVEDSTVAPGSTPGLKASNLSGAAQITEKGVATLEGQPTRP